MSTWFDTPNFFAIFSFLGVSFWLLFIEIFTFFACLGAFLLIAQICDVFRALSTTGPRAPRFPSDDRYAADQHQEEDHQLHGDEWGLD